MRIWIDIDNPPQVQYLTPFVAAFERRGADVRVTARGYGITSELLTTGAIEHRLVGGEFGASVLRKRAGTLLRAGRLAPRVAVRGRPRLLLSASRSAVVAARAIGVPSFMVLDYEHVELGTFRACRTTILHPDVIDPRAFAEQGIDPSRLVAFAGIKEDISFAPIDIGQVAPHDFGSARTASRLVLVRPPSETSHYFSEPSRELTVAALASLAADKRIQVVFSPRTAHQAQWLDRHAWPHRPIVLDRPLPFVALLKSVDAVVCAGGTMLREAAYLGRPAVSTFRSTPGAVDLWLEREGAVRFLHDVPDAATIDWASLSTTPIPRRPEVVGTLVEEILSRSST